ncbi:diguanylate cyclase domain-containing protein [Desulfonatronovibrio hydrogenovorans]|uniref:diguanylate cyclase domain-containing protein n=1 Tax=Desulfonatronovibrio hydrogenovorans TaxID=53245 RepID=UPI0004916051|nr:PleD family two-component system response regulator [Desulfonatronovibrio hydrogenovorans]
MTTNRPKILIVDDTPTNIEIIAEILEQEYEIVFAKDGPEGIAMAELHRPDLILLDIMMPEMDGFETCQKLKQNPVTKNIPVIFITALDMEEDEARGLQAGAIDYITKPIRPSVVRARIKNHVELKRHRDYLENISMMDGLTGIPNRRRFDEYLLQEWRRAQRRRTWISLLMLDIDHFKLYNDNYGHSKGDQCLKKVARTIEDVLTRPADLAARYGGEEFACVLPETDPAGASTMAEKIHAGIASLKIPHEYSPIDQSLTLSIGASSTIPEPGSSPDILVRKADQMLYLAKRSGRKQTRSQKI